MPQGHAPRGYEKWLEIRKECGTGDKEAPLKVCVPRCPVLPSAVLRAARRPCVGNVAQDLGGAGRGGAGGLLNHASESGQWNTLCQAVFMRTPYAIT